MSAWIRSLPGGTWTRVLIAWLALAVAMSINGVFRELVLRPGLGPRVAPLLSAILGIALVLLVTRGFLPPLTGLDTGTLLWISATIFLLTVAFETALGLLVDQKGWRALLEHYALWRGELWPVVLAILSLTPFIWGRWWPVE